jgi:hypothetical protein
MCSAVMIVAGINVMLLLQLMCSTVMIALKLMLPIVCCAVKFCFAVATEPAAAN